MWTTTTDAILQPLTETTIFIKKKLIVQYTKKDRDGMEFVVTLTSMLFINMGLLNQSGRVLSGINGLGQSIHSRPLL